MSPSVIAYWLQFLASLPDLIESGVEVVTMVKEAKAKLQQFKDENRDPTDLEWDDLNDSIAAKRRELHS